MVEGTALRRRRVVAWYGLLLTRLAGALLAAASLIWCVAGLAVVLFASATGWDFERDRSVSASVASVVAYGSLVGIPVFMLSVFLFLICHHFVDERLWRSGLRRGTATVHDLRPGHINSNSATQELTCRLEAHVVGMATIRGDYSGNIGPLDAPRFVEGATFLCEVSPRLPERVRVWPYADPHADELTGHYLDFEPVQPGRS